MVWKEYNLKKGIEIDKEDLIQLLLVFYVIYIILEVYLWLIAIFGMIISPVYYIIIIAMIFPIPIGIILIYWYARQEGKNVSQYINEKIAIRSS